MYAALCFLLFSYKSYENTNRTTFYKEAINLSNETAQTTRFHLFEHAEFYFSMNLLF